MLEMHITTSQEEQRWLRSEAGQALVEYALVLAFVSIAAVGLTPIGQWLSVGLTDVAAAL
jgi:Flp pilus assembly pilin Flp